jgi:hypothetical protein
MAQVRNGDRWLSNRDNILGHRSADGVGQNHEFHEYAANTRTVHAPTETILSSTAKLIASGKTKVIKDWVLTRTQHI